MIVVYLKKETRTSASDVKMSESAKEPRGWSLVYLAYLAGSEFTNLCPGQCYSLVSPWTIAQSPGLRLN